MSKTVRNYDFEGGRDGGNHRKNFDDEIFDGKQDHTLKNENKRHVNKHPKHVFKREFTEDNE